MGLNTQEYALFKKNREEWIECLNGNDRNSVRLQIVRMTWNVAAFRIVNQARSLAPAAPGGGVQLNGMVHELLNQSFAQSHMIAVRRLTDTCGLSGKKGVYSLISLINEIEKCRELVTREHLFEAEGLKYDYEDVKLKYLEFCQQQLAEGKKSYHVPPELWWERYEERHNYIDRLCAVRADARRKSDTIRPEVFAHLRQRLSDECTELENHVNKFLAHAATPGSRAIVDADSVDLKFSHLWNAHRAVCQVASFVNVHLLGGASLHPLAHPQFDQFAYIDQSLVTTDNVGFLRQAWENFDTETHAWGNWGMNELEAEMTAT